jgi:hypothetical protein
VLYLFEAAGSGGERWRIKLRATYQRQGEAVYARIVESLLGDIK